MDLPLITARSLSLLIVLLLHIGLSSAAKNPHCTPNCGVIHNISFPFRLNGDPKNCGDRRFELACENDVASLYLDSHKYYVKAVNYTSNSNNNNDDCSIHFTIRLVDAFVTNDTCSFPTSSLYHYNFTSFSTASSPHRRYPYETLRHSTYPYEDMAAPINFISCPYPLKNYTSSNFTYVNTKCYSNSSYSRYDYIKVGHMNASELKEACSLEKIALTSWPELKGLNNVSLSEIHDSLVYGFELFSSISCRPRQTIDMLWFFPATPIVVMGLLCAVVSPPVMAILGFAAIFILLYYTTALLAFSIISADAGTKNPKGTVQVVVIQLVIDLIIMVPRIIIFPLALWFLIYKFRRRFLSIYNIIESFLQSDNKLAPIRYSYSNIKKITLNFQENIGEGGYGSVYKGKLRSGHDVAVKLLGKSRGNVQDFMNEIGTIGRIHHVNVVKLVGYCAKGSKHALILDFMPNDSLEKYISNGEKLDSLSWATKFEIAVGVARGIKYLHKGCDVQILHFDIKPHNILLDDNFVPKISNFGLTKFCSIEKSAVTLTAARGTIGYVAPELICRSIGAVSYKADVYSFGMLPIEMVGLKRDLLGNDGGSSKYFPYWIYDCFEEAKDIEIGRGGENDNNDNTAKLVRKMTLVALWCVQMSPDARPSMNKVLEMLEGNVEYLRIPDYPAQSSQNLNVDQIGTTSWNVSSSVGINVQE